jgi:hypothetical protein
MALSWYSGADPTSAERSLHLFENYRTAGLVPTTPKISATTAKAAIMLANAMSATVILVRLDNTPTPITGNALPVKQ